MWKPLVALVAFAVVGAAPAAAQGWADKMFKDGLTKDFGSVPRGAQLFHRFKITNIYAVPMEITNLRTSCTCGTVTATVKKLEPREEGYVEVTMDTRRFTGSKTISIHVSVGPQFTSTAELRVTATSRADVVFNPGQASFGVVARGKAPTQTVDVEYAGTLNWQVSEVVTNNAPVDVALKELYRRPGQVGYQVSVTLKPDAPAGALKQELFLKTNDPASPLVPLLVEATIQAPLSVTPDPVKLGALKVGEAKTQRVVVRGSKPFRILAIDGLGEGLTAEFPPEAAAAHVVTVKCQPGKEGEFKRQLTIKTDLDKDAQVTLTVQGAAAP